LRLQEKVAAGNLTGAQASDVLKQANARRVPIDVILSERNSKDDEIVRANEVLDLIITCGLISKEEFGKAENVSKATNISLGEVMLNNGTIGRPLLRNAVQALEHIRSRMLTLDQAAAALRYSTMTGVDFANAVKEVALLPAQPLDEGSSPDNNSWLNKLWGKMNS
jgi:hypothetical protein